MKTYKDVYELPLRVDDIGWVRDEKDQFVFQFQFDEKFLQGNIISVINGTEKPKYQHEFIHKEGIISEGCNDFILIRGWGHLTGIGGLNLSTEEACNIQDTFAEFIVEQLNQKPENNNL